MHMDGSPSIRRALVADGLFCIVAGAAVATTSGWLVDEVPVARRGWIVAAGVISAVWGLLLVGAARRYPTRAMVLLVAVVNAVFVAASLAWLVIDGEAMSALGIAVVGIIGISVLRFAISQASLLRQ